jgi:hypothetical protein
VKSVLNSIYRDIAVGSLWINKITKKTYRVDSIRPEADIIQGGQIEFSWIGAQISATLVWSRAAFIASMEPKDEIDSKVDI